MGQQAGTTAFALIGNVIGSYLLGPIGGAIGSMAGGMLGSLLFNHGNRPLIPDVSMMGSSFGNPIPIIYGTVRLPGTVLWMSEVVTKGHGVGKGGGLLGGSGASSYYQNASVGFCEGPAQLVKIYLDGKLFLDNTTDSQEIGSYRFVLREYTGGEAQLPDHLYTEWVDAHIISEAAPAYRDLAHMIFEQIDLAHFGNRFPQTSAVWSTSVTVNTIFRRLNPQVPTISSGLFPTHPEYETEVGGIGFGYGTAVDWARNLAYQVTPSGNVLVFDLRTQQCILAKTIQQLSGEGAGGGIPWPNMAAKIGELQPFAGLCCGLGTKLYVYGHAHGLLFTTEYVWTIDPDTLTVIRETAFLDNSFADQILAMICFTVSTPAGAVEMLAGHTLFFLSGPPVVGSSFVLEPIDSQICRLATSAMGILSTIGYAVGNQDPVTGATDLWMVSGSAFDTAKRIFIQKTIIIDTDPSALAAQGYPISVASFGPADFGITDPDPLWSGGVGNPVYDPSDGSLIITSTLYAARSGPSGWFSWKWNPSSGIVWIKRDWTGPQWPMTNTYLDRGMIAGDIVFPRRYISVVDTTTGVVSQSPIGSADAARFPAAVTGNIHYDSFSNSLVYTDLFQGLTIAYLQRVFGNEVSVAGIIQDLCSRAGLDPATEVDVSEVTQTTIGFAVLQQKSAGQAIADLCTTYQIDMVESDYKLKFIPRGQAPVATLTQTDLASTDQQDDAKYWIPKRAQELEMPLQITVKYPDPNLDYQPGSAYAKRTALPVPTVFSKRKKTIDLPVVASSTEAQQIAEKMLYTIWAERTTFETGLGQKYLWLDPTDNITVDLDSGDSYTTRIESIELGADYALKMKLASEDITTYSGSTSLGPTYGQTPQTIVQAPFGNILLFNVPLLQDSDDTAGATSRIYFAAGAYGTGWIGGGMYNSLDGATWTLVQSMPLAIDWGYATTALADTPAKFATDYTNTLRVVFSPGSTVPSSCTYTDLMNGVNPALLGSEIIQFMTVTDNHDGSFQLSGLARGRRGTEWATGTHHSGEQFILLEDGRLGSYRMPLAQIAQPEAWRLVPLNRFIDQAPSNTFTYLGYDLKPYAPVAFKRALSGSDLVLTWVRRTRLGGLLIDGSDTAPLGEATEAYEVYLLASAGALASFDPATPATYVRAFTSLTTPTVTYTAAMMVTDSFTPATDVLYMVAYQVSAVIGRGFQGYQALPPF